MSRNVIRVENVSKAYRLGQIGSGTLTDDIKVWWAKRGASPILCSRSGRRTMGIGMKNISGRSGMSVLM